MDIIKIPGQKAASLDFLSGGGEMGERIRNFDWQNTPLGPVEKWSQSLRTTVGLILSQRFPMLLWWGPDYISIYNDAYIPVLGDKHPWGLGLPVKECWREIWNVLQPLIDTPFYGGPSTWIEDFQLQINRKGFWEETHFTVAYSPVPDETTTNRIGGVLATVHEITDKIIHERSLATLRELGTVTFEEKSLDTIYRNVADVLGKNNKDFPFALVYKITDDRNTVTVVASTGIDKEQNIFPGTIDIAKPTKITKGFCQAYQENKVVVSEIKSYTDNLPKGFWEMPPGHFVHIPVGGVRGNHTCAIITAALNPYRKFDESYRQFCQLIGERVSLEIHKMVAWEEERKRAEALAEVDKAKTAFFTNISHEFRTPITLMLGSFEEILNDRNTIPENLKRLEMAHRNGLRLLKLVNTLLDFSRIQSGRQQASYILTDIAAYTKNLASNFRSVVENAGLKFTVNADSFIQPVYVDPEMWGKIIFNLLSNAFKYTLKGGITLSITALNNRVILKVKDTGVGIPGNELPKIFERFHRVQNVTGRTYEGTGIGLSLVKELVQLHDGEISVTSKVGKGSEFIVSIPAEKPHLPAENIAEREHDFNAALADTFVEEATSFIDQSLSEDDEVIKKDAETILVVDDNADMRRYLKKMLHRHYNVITAANGADALDQVKEFSPQLVVSDIMMPVMDGIQLLKTLKEHPQTANLPVILVSARAGEEAKIEGYDIGADDYLVKPFSAKELLARIDAQIRIQKKRNNALQSIYALFNEVPFAVMVLKGEDLVIEYINQYNLNLWQLTKEEVTGRPLFKVRPDIQKSVESIHREVYGTGKRFVANEIPVDMEIDGKAKRRYFNSTIDPMFDDDGKIIGQLATSIDITEQVVARKQIEKSEKELQELFIQAPVAIILFEGKDLIAKVANDTALKMIGKSKEETINKSIFNLFPDHPQRTNLYSEVFNTGIPYTGKEVEIKLKRNNKWHTDYYDLNYTPWHDGDGKIKGVLAVGTDVTEKILARKKIIESEERFRTMANEAPIFVWETDETLQTTYLNKEGLNYFDLARDFKLSGLSWKKFIHPDDIERVLNIMNEAAGKKQSYTLEMRLKNGATGEYRWFLDKGAPTYDEERFTGFIGTSFDINERKEAEKELAEKVADRTRELNYQNILLKQQNNLVKKILDSSVDLIAVYDTDERVISINQSSLGTLGLQKEEDILGRKLIEIVPQVKGSKGQEDLLRAIKGETIHNKIYYSPLTRRYYENFLIPLKDDNDKTYAVLVIAHDNTELITSSEQLQLKNDELQKTIQRLHSQELREEQKNNFIQMASHELKTPITSMQGYVQVLLSAYKEDSGKTLPPLFVRSSLTSIEKQIKRLTRLISELLDLSKIDSGQLKLNSELFSLNELAIDIVQDILHTNPKHSINLFHDFECNIYGDKDRIGQVLTNLLTNAIKYSPSSEKIDVWIKKTKDNKAAVSVKDYGIGIDGKEQAKIFERFYRIKGEEVETYPGFGIGLFIAKDIVQKHDGELTVESEIKKGSVFTFTLSVKKHAMQNRGHDH